VYTGQSVHSIETKVNKTPLSNLILPNAEISPGGTQHCPCHETLCNNMCIPHRKIHAQCKHHSDV